MPQIARIFCVLSALLVPLPTLGQTFDIRQGDTLLSADEIKRALVGRHLNFRSNGGFVFTAAMTLIYLYGDGTRLEGTYEITADGQVCLAYENGHTRCDHYARNTDGDIVMVAYNGMRFVGEIGPLPGQ